MRKALLAKIFDEHVKLFPKICREKLLLTVLDSYNIGTLQKLTGYSFSPGLRGRARLVLYYMGHDSPCEVMEKKRKKNSEENFDDE